jgi:hypothetical protein
MHDEADASRADAGEDPDEHERQSGELRRLAAANEDATWGDADRSRLRVPGVFSGEVGPKGKVSAQLRSLSRAERGTLGSVPYGTTVPRTGRLVLIPLLLIAAALLALVALLVWLAW